MIRWLIAFYILCFSLNTGAQGTPKLEKSSSRSYHPWHKTAADYIYDNDLPGRDFYKLNREALRAKMPPNSVAVLFANPVMNRSGEVNFIYHQDPNFYYLTGLREPHAMILIFKEEQDLDSMKVNELLFVQENDSKEEIWHGRRIGLVGARRVLGISAVEESRNFALFPLDWNNYDNIFYSMPGVLVEDDPHDRGDLSSMRKHFFKKVKHLDERKQVMLNDMLGELRAIKKEEELKLITKAIEITCNAQNELMRMVKPGMKEYEAQAIAEYVFTSQGAESEAFPSILGSGENSCILHFNGNRREMGRDELLVCDVGAEYHGYAADITRTIPVNGKFSEEETIIYNIVLEAQNAGIKAALSGNKFWDPHRAAKAVLFSRLKELGIIENFNELEQYFMHGTTHYLGLDVHDSGPHNTLKPGNIISIEPGIYIPENSKCDTKWWNISIRIEDNILITKSGPVILSECVPRTIAEIEAMMAQDPQYITPSEDR